MSKIKLRNVEYIYNYGLDIEQRKIIFSSCIDNQSSLLFLKNLAVLESISYEPINIIFSSTGGVWEDGMMVFDYIEHLKKRSVEINFYCTGIVASMGTVLLQAATTRFSLPNSTFLIHYGTSSICDDTQYKEAQAVAKYEKNIQEKKMMELLGKNKKGIKKLEKLMNKEQEVYLTPKQALSLNIIDKITDALP